MDNFSVKKIIIGEKNIDMITDKDGINWYPFKYFLRRILCKYDDLSSFRDSNMIKYMKVFDYQSLIHFRKNKTWFMNEDGIKYLLRHMNIVYKGSQENYNVREKAFFEACIYFKVKPKIQLNPKIINVPPPNLKDYDVWSLLCIENDGLLNSHSQWKECNSCNYFYPNTINYFKNNKDKCTQCQGEDFKCKNERIQYIYDNNGLNLLYLIYINDSPEKIKEELLKFLNYEN